MCRGISREMGDRQLRFRKERYPYRIRRIYVSETNKTEVMPIVIKEIHVRTTIDRNGKPGFVSEDMIQRIKNELLREIQKSKVVVQRKRKER